MLVKTTTLAGFSSAIIAAMIAVIGAYLAIDRKVEALANTMVTPTGVEHLVDLKTTSKLDEILHRLERMEDQLDRLAISAPKR